MSYALNTIHNKIVQHHFAKISKNYHVSDIEIII